MLQSNKKLKSIGSNGDEIVEYFEMDVWHMGGKKARRLIRKWPCIPIGDGASTMKHSQAPACTFRKNYAA